MRNITIVCGAIISGTSMIAKLCHANSAWMGELESSNTKGFDVYENKEFRYLCRNALEIEHSVPPNQAIQQFKLFYESLPEDKPIVLKYPKSLFLFEEFLKIFDFKAVYVLRNPFFRAKSLAEKNGDDAYRESLEEWHMTYQQILRFKGLNVYTLLWERFFVDPEMETKRLADFIGLPTRNTDSIDLSKRHF